MLTNLAVAVVALTAGFADAIPRPVAEAHAKAFPAPAPQLGKKSAVPGQCSGQSCYVASLAHTTNEPFKLQNGKKPGGGNPTGDRCIKSSYSKLGLSPPEGLRRYIHGEGGPNGNQYPQDDWIAISNYLMGEDAAIPPSPASDAVPAVEASESDMAAEAAPGAACKGNILLFARGTTETGTMGTTVGPALSSRLTGDWEVIGVKYDASLNGIYCIGMPGGFNAKTLLESKVKSCPDSKLFLSGYSQGAMVVREAVAWTNAETRSHVAGIVTFGDPFNGATVKGFDKSKIKVLCNKTDGVCVGEFTIGAGHLSYVADGSVGEGVNWLKKMSSSTPKPGKGAKGADSEGSAGKKAAKGGDSEEAPAAAEEEAPAPPAKGKKAGAGKKGGSGRRK